MFDRNNYKMQWLIGIFFRFLSSKDNLMKETKFPLSTTFNSLPDCWSCAGWEDWKGLGNLFNLF